MNEAIIESGMKFGPYDAGLCFHIEKSKLYGQLGRGVQIAEFAVLRTSMDTSAVWLVEAKSSSPRPGNPKDFDEFIKEIVEKMRNTLLILLAALLERHPDTTELSGQFKALDLKVTAFKFVLVINGHQDEWLPPLQDALNKALAPLIKTLVLTPLAVAVINEKIAVKLKLITDA